MVIRLQYSDVRRRYTVEQRRLKAAAREFSGAALTDDLALLLMRPYDTA